MNILEIKNLNLGFDTESGFLQALHDVCLTLQAGQIHALVGESGCGKSMSAMSILQLLPKTALITSGEIIFHDKNSPKPIDILNLEKNELEKIRGAKIALIPQDPMTSLNPLYTIENQLLEVIKKHQGLRGKKAKEKAIEALEMVQIPSVKTRIKSYPHEFSGGMKQRAIIAMALACNAQILIADEPTTALDVTIQAQIMKLLDEIKTNLKTSILLITHDLALVKDNSDKVSVMYLGRIVESAPTEIFFMNPLHPYSRALLKSLPQEKGQKLSVIEGQPPSLQQKILGCPFNPRCEFATDICKNEIPQLKEISLNHFCACHLQ